MRKSLLAGGALAIAAGIAVWLGEFFGLDLESFVVLGVALGAVVALVPDGRPGFRLLGFAGGIIVTVIVYALRAAVLPDTSNGRAVAAFLMVALCVAVTAAGVGRIPLWSTLLGAGTMVGAYEHVFAAATPEFTTTSVSTLTSVVFAAGVGFLVASFFAPSTDPEHPNHRAELESDDSDGFFDNDNKMERAQ